MKTSPRRLRLQAASGIALDGAAPTAPAVAPGRSGEFDFLHGEWRIRHRRRVDGQWDEFDGEASCWSVLDGRGSVEELRVPARQFAGLGLRLLDPQQRWIDFWISARTCVISPPGMPGAFVDGVGTFEAEEEDQGQRILVRGIWDHITPQSHRWHQQVSRDGGLSWDANWFMGWSRVAHQPLGSSR